LGQGYIKSLPENYTKDFVLYKKKTRT